MKDFLIAGARAATKKPRSSSSSTTIPNASPIHTSPPNAATSTTSSKPAKLAARSHTKHGNIRYKPSGGRFAGSNRTGAHVVIIDKGAERMNRRDAGFTAVGIFGAVVGAGCASPRGLGALPSGAEQDPVAEAAAAERLSVEPVQIFMPLGSSATTFRVTAGHFYVTVSSSACYATIHGDKLGLIPNTVGSAEVVVIDKKDHHERLRFNVQVE
jgi:hypothetical protein